MHRVASFISGFVLSPSNWVLLLLVLSLVVKKERLKKMLRIGCAIVFLIFSSPLLINWYGHKWQWPRAVISGKKHYSCGIVLGGFASIDADNTAYFNGAADRFIQILKLYKLGVIEHILVSGGNGKKVHKDFGEAAFTKQELLVMGVPDSSIIVEDRSDNTADNARNSKQLLDSLQFTEPYLLITSASHMRRAYKIFLHAGIPVTPFACNYSGANKPFTFRSLLPSFGVLSDWDGYLKEAAGYWWYR
jgi:uncharacterized SAM-binding protein YcdF (DUF218 family)